MKLTRLARAIILSSSLLTSIHSTPVHAAAAIQSGGAAVPIVWAVLSFCPGIELGAGLGAGLGLLVGGGCGGALSGGSSKAVAGCGGCLALLGGLAGFVGMVTVFGFCLEESNQTNSELEPAMDDRDLEKLGLTATDMDAYNNMVGPYNDAQTKFLKAVATANEEGDDEAARAAWLTFNEEINNNENIDNDVLARVAAHQQQQMPEPWQERVAEYRQQLSQQSIAAY